MSGPRILVVAYDGERKPSTRLRILQYIPALEARGLAFDCVFVSQGVGRRAGSILTERIDTADVVFVQRVLSRGILRALQRSKKPVIFDVDDAIHMIRQAQYPRAVDPRRVADRARNLYRTAVRGSRLFSSRKRLLDEMLGRATTTIVGNRWLFDDLGLSDERAVMLPTSVWLDGVPIKQHDEHRPTTIGWIGVQSNLYHLGLLEDTFSVLRDRYAGAVELNIVSSESATTPLPTRFTPWSLETESDSVLSFDVGIMPLQDDPFSRGKCAFKAVFCMSRGVPVVASPVGSNTDLIEHGVNGLLASTRDEWINALSLLIEDEALRARLGREARKTIGERYSAGTAAVRLSEVLARAVDLSASASSAASTT